MKEWVAMVRIAEPRAATDRASALCTGPFHTALRVAVRERGLTLDRLRSHLSRRGTPVSLSTLSDWQHGQSRPAPRSLPAVAALEEILRVPRGSLVRLLRAPCPPHAAAPAHRGEGIDERGGALGELLDGLPAAGRRMDVPCRQDKVFVDRHGRSVACWTRLVVRADEPVDRYVLRYFGDPGCVIERARLDMLENCRLGEVRRHPAGVMVAELLFDTVLRAGETWVLEFRLFDDTGSRSTEHAYAFRQPGDQYLLEVRFHPAALPEDCYAFAKTGLHECQQRTADLTVNRHHAAHLLVTSGRGGLVGIGWSWPGPARAGRR